MDYQILLIEDEKVIAQAMTNFLIREGYGVTSVLSGDEGLEAFKNSEFHLILLDMMLPGINGELVLKKIRQKSILKKVPVIMATAKGTEYDKVKCLDLGADDYIAKPFSPREVCARVRTVLRRYQKVKEYSNRNQRNYHNWQLLYQGFRHQ